MKTIEEKYKEYCAKENIPRIMYGIDDFAAGYELAKSEYKERLSDCEKSLQNIFQYHNYKHGDIHTLDEIKRYFHKWVEQK